MTPSTFKPERLEDFVGSTGRLAAQLAAKVLRLKADPNARFKALFYGWPGTAKTELAKFIARRLSEHELAIELLNGQSMSVERVREWHRQRCYRPIHGDWTLIIVNELDSASPEAHSELLEYLDSLPPHFAFLATTNKKLEDSATPKADLKDCLPKRIHSRFIAYKFLPVQAAETAAFVCQRWGLPYETALRIAEANQGDVRGCFNDIERHLDSEAIPA
jgi:replication-associated recombination protein RarA